MIRFALAALFVFSVPASAQVGVNTTPVSGGSSTPQVYGVLIDKNGLLGDAAREPSLSNGITGPIVGINSNTAPLGNIATSIGGGVAPTFAIGTADEGETIYSAQSWGTNSNSTFSCMKARGTGANPLPLLNGDIICVIVGNGWQLPGRMGGAAGTGVLEYRACEDWDAFHTGTSVHLIAQKGGTAYPIDPIERFKIECDGSITMPTAVSTTVNQNADTLWTINNNSTGINATAGLIAANGTGAAVFGMAGTGYSAIPLLRNSAFLNSTPGANGVVINARGTNKPIILANDDIESGRAVGGVMAMRSGYAAGGVVGVSCSGPPTADFTSVGGIVTHC